MGVGWQTEVLFDLSPIFFKRDTERGLEGVGM